jgi:hypothetical protein
MMRTENQSPSPNGRPLVALAPLEHLNRPATEGARTISVQLIRPLLQSCNTSTSEALEAINEAKALAERFEQRWWCAELHRLRGVFLRALDADESQIEASFREAIRIAKEQKSISLAKRAEASYAEYRRQKASALGAVRLPLC